MYRIYFFLLVIVFSVPSRAEATDIPVTDSNTSVAVLSQGLQDAISTDSVLFKNYLTSGDPKVLERLPEDLKKEAEGKKPEVAALINANDFLNKYFSVGLYANFDVSSDKRVQNARVVNGIVRVEESNSAQLGFALQAHLLIPRKSGKSAWGPFVAVISSSEGAISSGAIGVVYAIAPRSGFVSQQTSINYGLGVSVSPGSQVLGEGIYANQPLPSGETEVRYKKITLYGILITVSFGF